MQVSVNSTAVSKFSYRRLVIQPDPIIGYRFIPNIYSRVTRKNNTFIIQTNEQGFRDNISFDKKDKEMVMSWYVVVRKEKEIVNLYCPECWGRSLSLIKSIKEDLSERAKKQN